MALDLRPLTLGELFDRAFVLYRRHFWLFVGITAVPGVFALLVSLGQQTFQNMAGSTAALAPEDQLAGAFVALGVAAGVFVALLAYLVVYTISLGATTYAVSEIYMGRAVTVSDVYRRVRAHIGRLLALMLVVGFRIGAVVILGLVIAGLLGAGAAAIHPLVAFIVMLLTMLAVASAAVVMTMRYSLAVPSLVLEELWSGDSIRRSIALTRGRLGRVFLLILCATMVTYATTLLFQGPWIAAAFAVGLETRAAMWLNIIAAFTGTIGTTLTAPFMIIGLALLYYDARIREEGFDLEMTLASLDGAAPVPTHG